MRISRLELKNFRTFGHVVFDSLPDTLVLVSPNGRGKSSILEAIAGAHDLVAPYHQDQYPFSSPWQQRHVPIWPQHLPVPVKIGERTAEVTIKVEATSMEQAFLTAGGVTEFTGKAHFVIEDGRHIAAQNVNETIKRLFRFHNPSDGVGFIDYIRPIRFYRNRVLGDFASDLTDERLRGAFSEFHRPYHEHDKFSALKSYLVGCQLDDLSHRQATGEVRDSLALFREVFDHFFSPKKFIGYRSQSMGGRPEVVVTSPFGTHDTDALSDGEKEALHIFAHLYRFRSLENTVLWDTPELHLNAALESRLFDAIRKIAPENQYWIATHSLEFINSVPLENVFVIRQTGTSASVERASGNERQTRVKMYREMGAQVGLQLVSTVVVFVEGKQADSDKLKLDRLIAPEFPGVNFVAGGSCENLLSLGTRANLLLEEACTNGDFLALVDRDYRDDEEWRKAESSYNGRVFMWYCHEIENLFLDPSVMIETLRLLGHLGAEETPETLMAKLKDSARALREWIAADWVAWEFDRSLQSPARRISGDNPKDSLQKYAAALQSRIVAATDATGLETRRQERVAEIDRLLATKDGWLTRLPGKQLLKKFLEHYPSLGDENYLRVAVGVVLDKKVKIAELDRLRGKLRQIPATTAK